MVNTAHEIAVLTVAIKAHGKRNADGNLEIPYGDLFKATEHTLEALNGTLRSAKRQKKVTFAAELLMMPKDQDVPVVLLDEGNDASHGGQDERSLP
ncbi:hypothetical protein JCM5296_003080 [Sporobolomyces johnsonii]